MNDFDNWKTKRASVRTKMLNVDLEVTLYSCADHLAWFPCQQQLMDYLGVHIIDRTVSTMGSFAK